MRLFDRRVIYIFDTSIFIDGRVIPMFSHHLFNGKIVVPAFVLRELQQLADSKDYVTSRKAKRGFATLQEFKEAAAKIGEEIDFNEREFDNLKDVDDKLMACCLADKAILVTVDGNLTKVAKIRGIQVLNVNHLVTAVRFNVQRGDQFALKLTDVGHLEGQAVGYRQDGLMVVVQNGMPFFNKIVTVKVHRVLSLENGPIVFADVV